jgi:hypothetical protein
MTTSDLVEATPIPAAAAAAGKIDEAPERNQPTCRGDRLRPGDFSRVIFAHVLLEGMDWRRALTPEYWLPAMHKLSPGSRIECRSSDWRTQFEILIFDVSERVNPPLLDMGFRAIWPPDLDLPPPVERKSRYHIRQFGVEFQVVDWEGKLIGTYPDRIAAGDVIALLEREMKDRGEDWMPGGPWQAAKG